MRCRSCGYSLWGITTGRCPECDAPFRASEYHFRPRAVSFACAKGGAAYAGTSLGGHLEPNAFSCVQCGEALTMDAMVVTPAPGVSEAETMQWPNPWMDRARTGRIKAFFKSIIAIPFEPMQFMRSIVERNPSQGMLRDAMKFAACMTVLAWAPLFAVLLIGTALVVAWGGAARAGPPMLAASTVLLVFSVLIMPFAFIVFPLLMSLIGHGALRLVDGHHGGLGRTAQCTLYSSAGMAPASFLLGLIPLGGFVAFGWQCWVLTMLLREAHRTTTARAVAGTVAVVLIPILAVVGLMLMLILGGLSAMNTAAARATTIRSVAAAQMTASTLANQLSEMHEHGGIWPPSPLDGIATGEISGPAFVETALMPLSPQSAIGSVNATTLLSGANPAVASEAKALAARVPPDGAPFRLGNAVFTYGMSDGDASDWLIVKLPTSLDKRFLIVTLIDETSVAPADFDSEFEQLNIARKRRMLRALPDPRLAPDVTNSAPGT